MQYSLLAMQQKLFPHLWEVQEAAERRLKQIMDGLLAQNPGPDKAVDQLGWVTASELPESTGGGNHLFRADFCMNSGGGVVKHDIPTSKGDEKCQ